MKVNKQIKVKFSYNEDLVEVMRGFNGYYRYKEKAWYFPASKLSDLREELTRRMYTVRVITE